MENQLQKLSLKERTKKSLIILVVAILCDVGLALVKLYVGLAANSLMIMLDAVNSFFDVLTAIATVVAFSLLFIKSDEKAPFGYGRSEYVAGFIVATVSVVLGGVFFMRSLNRLAMPEPLYFGTLYCTLIAIALAVKIGLAVMFALANKKYKSKALSALMLDSFLDIGITTASVISFAVSAYVEYAVDAIFGIVVSIIIVVYGVLMIVDNLKGVVLGDKCEKEKEAVRTVFSGLEGVKGVAKIMLHDYGFNVKIGTIEIVPESIDDIGDLLARCEETSAKLKSEEGISVQIVLKRKSDEETQEN
ncbi:MAG: cation diffusion facilitator family transporter [Clostridia bacterium]|nr:cation diffusion facilitator family transporter [Clostridia bacterium]